MAAPVIQFKRGLLANLPGLKGGEPGFTTDSYDFYIGVDETTANNQFVGSGRYWSVGTASTGSGVKLVEGTNNGTNSITLKAPDSIASNLTYVLPGTDGSNGHVLTTNGSGTLSFAAPAASSFTISADSGTDDTFNTGETLTFTGGEGVDTTVTNNTITIAAEDASNSNKGIASFATTDFSVSSGVVSLKTEKIQDITGAQLVTNGSHTRITATYDDANDGAIDLVVDNDLSNYDNSTSAFITAASTHTLTNKTFDANGTGNSLSNVEVADFASGVVDTDISSVSGSDDTLASAKAIKTYVDAQVSGVDLEFGIAGDSGIGTVATSGTLTVSGTTDEIVTSASGTTVTVGLPDNVTISQNLTVTGNLYVNGSTTQVNTSQTTIEDQLLELGMVDGSAPSSDLNKDLGVLFNYYSGSAKKAAVYWDDSTSRVVVSQDVSESSGVLTNNTSGALEVASIYVNGCTGSAVEVIGCSGGEVVITNATIDGGSF